MGNDTAAAPHLLGYVRVSTTSQTTDQQEDALIEYGVPRERMFGDRLSGKAGTERPGLQALLDYARAGDVIVVVGIDRLGRSVAEVSSTIAELSARGITLRSLREGIDTSTAAGRMIASVLASIAELELELGRERRAASREARRARGLPATRPPKLSATEQQQLVRLRQTGEPVSALMSLFGVSRSTVFRVLAEHRAEGDESERAAGVGMTLK
ncbi:recombinase family protein [Tsukamurella ocularis]